MRALALALLLALAATAGAAELKPFDAGSLAAIRAARPGKPFILAFWSVSCVPCREEMAHWGPWRRKYPGVDVVLVAVDEGEGAQSAASILAAHDLAGVETWAFADDYAERLRWSVDPAWMGEVPKTYFHDAAHKAQAKTGRLDPAAVEAWLAGQSRRPRSR